MNYPKSTALTLPDLPACYSILSFSSITLISSSIMNPFVNQSSIHKSMLNASMNYYQIIWRHSSNNQRRRSIKVLMYSPRSLYCSEGAELSNFLLSSFSLMRLSISSLSFLTRFYIPTFSVPTSRSPKVILLPYMFAFPFSSAFYCLPSHPLCC